MQIQSAAHQIQLASCPQCNRAAWRPAGYQDGQSLFCDRMGDLTYAGAIQQVETTLDFFFFFLLIGIKKSAVPGARNCVICFCKDATSETESAATLGVVIRLHL